MTIHDQTTHEHTETGSDCVSAAGRVLRHRAPFAAMSYAYARLLAENGSPSDNGFRLHGAWERRRFVIARLSRSPVRISLPRAYLEHLALDLPTRMESQRIIAECRSFGMRVELRCRQIKLFEVQMGDDGQSHIVHAYHHVAACGFRGPWMHEPASAGAPTCQYCLIASAIRPLFRARYHPAVED
jgi:hypothetical protein